MFESERMWSFCITPLVSSPLIQLQIWLWRKVKSKCNFRYAQKWCWQYWKTRQMYTTWTFPSLKLVVFHCFLSSDNPMTYLTWLFQWQNSSITQFWWSEGANTNEIYKRMIIRYGDICMNETVYEWSEWSIGR
jgi:hypothetical protein